MVRKEKPTGRDPKEVPDGHTVEILKKRGIERSGRTCTAEDR